MIRLILVTMNCINCNQESTGNFCPNCGQRTITRRITFREGWNDFWARIYGFDGMFPRTLRDLTIRPGVATRKFIEGNRVLYYGPVGYFFLMITLMLLLYDLMGISFLDVMKATGQSMSTGEPQTQNQAVFMQKALQAISDNIKLFFFAWIPFQAFASRYIFFRKANLNFIEHTLLPLYVMGHNLWMNIVLGAIYAINGQYYTWIPSLISFLYFGFAYSTMMTYQSRVKAFFKGIGVWLISYVLFILSFMILALLIVLLVGLINPEALKSWFNS
jgi:predicted RNA-binding Zn-ribbon protein involved in translation (DUF1610 family)